MPACARWRPVWWPWASSPSSGWPSRRALAIEWVLADLAVMLAGAATTTIYPTTSESDVTYIARDSQSRIVFAEDDAQIAKLRANRSQLPDVVKVVTFDGAG